MTRYIKLIDSKNEIIKNLQLEVANEAEKSRPIIIKFDEKYYIYEDILIYWEKLDYVEVYQPAPLIDLDKNDKAAPLLYPFLSGGQE